MLNINLDYFLTSFFRVCQVNMLHTCNTVYVHDVETVSGNWNYCPIHVHKNAQISFLILKRSFQ